MKIKLAVTVGIMSLMIGVIQGFKIIETDVSPKKAVRDIAFKAYGPLDAPIKILEYTDFQCPACAHGAKIMKQFLEENIGRVYVRYHHYPIPSLHPHAIKSAIYAECMGRQDKFWSYHDLLFERRSPWIQSLIVDQKLLSLAEEVGGDRVALKECVADPEVESMVLVEKIQGKQKGVRATPTYYINGKMVVGTNKLMTELQAIRKAL